MNMASLRRPTHSLAEDLHDMKPVEGEMGVGEVFPKAQEEAGDMSRLASLILLASPP